MAYSFPKFSFFIGIILISIVSTQIFIKHLPEVPNEEILKTSLQKSIEGKMCSGKYPVFYETLKKHIPMIKDVVNQQILLIATISSFVLLIIFTLIPQKGFFTWGFVKFFTLIFLILTCICGYLYFVERNTVCLVVKQQILKAELPKFSFEQIQQHPYFKQVLGFIPADLITKFNKFKAVFFTLIDKLGITSPIFVIVIAFYLINEQTAKVTKNSILVLVALVVSLITGINYFTETHDIIFSIIFPLIFIILVWIVVNILFRFGYLFVAPSFLFSCYVVAFRIGVLAHALGFAFHFELSVACFIFFFANVFVWTNSGSYLTIVYLLNYGLTILYPLPADSLVILVFLVQLFVGSNEPKQEQQAPKVDDKKVKKD